MPQLDDSPASGSVSLEMENSVEKFTTTDTRRMPGCRERYRLRRQKALVKADLLRQHEEWVEAHRRERQKTLSFVRCALHAYIGAAVAYREATASNPRIQFLNRDAKGQVMTNFWWRQLHNEVDILLEFIDEDSVAEQILFTKNALNSQKLFAIKIVDVVYPLRPKAKLNA